MNLKISMGQASQSGVRLDNQDFCGAVTPENDTLTLKGAIFALADGVGGHAGGREASEMTVRNILNDYYATPDTWSIPHALDKVIASINTWLRGYSQHHQELKGMATTLSLVTLRGSHYTIAHVGDSRIYLLRNGILTQLTTDHVWDMPDMKNVLKRAVGLDERLQVDFSEGEIQQGDIFALLCDGVWGSVDSKKIVEILNTYKDYPQNSADELIKIALKNGSQDNVTSLIIKIDQIGKEHISDVINHGIQLNVPPKFKAGQKIDDFEILDLIYESRVSFLYLVKNIHTNQQYILKTLSSSQENNIDAYRGLINEEWLGKKVVAHYFPQILSIPISKKSYLYYVMTYHRGLTLEQKLEHGHQFLISELTNIALRVTRALATLHRLNIIHRDIKPANIHQDDDGKIRVLDLGVAYYPSMISGDQQLSQAGTPSFMAPELLSGSKASTQTDLYALVVSLYFLLTRHYPYGEIEPFQNPVFGDPIPPTRYRPDIPKWFEAILLKAVAREPSQRFETAEELLLALEFGEHRALDIKYESPLAQRDPVFLWKLLTMISVVLNLLLIYLLAVGKS